MAVPILMQRQMPNNTVGLLVHIESQHKLRIPCQAFGRPSHLNQPVTTARVRGHRPSAEPNRSDSKPVSQSNKRGFSTTSSSSSTPSPKRKDEDKDEDADEDGPTAVELATATSFIEKVSLALLMYGLTVLLSSLSGVDATAGLTWQGGAPLAAGALTAAPVVLAIAALFLLPLDPGFSQAELAALGEVDAEVEAEAFLTIDVSLKPDSDEARPPITPAALKQGLWVYQMSVLKPWYPNFETSSVGLLFLASCTATSAQELLVRGYGGSILQGWYNGLLAGTTDVNNPIYWAKVFKLVTPETARWLAAFSLTALQVALSSTSADRAARFTRLALNRAGRSSSAPGVKGMLVENTTVSIEPGTGVLKPLATSTKKDGEGEKKKPTVKLGALEVDVDVDVAMATRQAMVGKLVTVEQQQQEGSAAGAAGPKVNGSNGRVLLPLPTAEERVVYWTNLGVTLLLCGAANLAWAASGSLFASFTAQVVIDGLVTALQQYKSTRLLPEGQLWEAVRKQREETEDEDDD